MMIGVCIYLEIIIVNVFGIGENTQKHIKHREINERISNVEEIRLSEKGNNNSNFIY